MDNALSDAIPKHTFQQLKLERKSDRKHRSNTNITVLLVIC